MTVLMSTVYSNPREAITWYFPGRTACVPWPSAVKTKFRAGTPAYEPGCRSSSGWNVAGSNVKASKYLEKFGFRVPSSPMNVSFAGTARPFSATVNRTRHELNRGSMIVVVPADAHILDDQVLALGPRSPAAYRRRTGGVPRSARPGSIPR